MIPRTLQRLYPHHQASGARVSLNEAAGEVCTATCRRESRLETYHHQAQYYTLVHR